MSKMGWQPGQALGKCNNGLLKPLEGKKLLREQQEGLGFSEQIEKELQIPEKIVDVLKLKTEQSNNQGVEAPKLNSVFEEEKELIARENYKSEILVEVLGLEIVALLDTGSDVTCISEELWKELKLRDSNLPVMPIKPIQIKTAVGQKSSEVRFLTMLPLKLDTDIIEEVVVLVITGLTSPFIIGFDWMKQNQARIDLELSKESFSYLRSGKKCTIKFHKRKTLNINRIDVNDDNDKINLEEMKIGVQLDEKDKGKFLNLLDKYKRLFSSQFGRANCYEHVINMDPHTPVVKKTYPVPYAYRGKVEAKLKVMEEQGILSRTSTPYCSPLTFTLKKDGDVRVLLDAREINQFMIAETEKPPMQLDVINSFHGANFISVVDLNNAYFQIPISEESKKYTGFSFNGKSYVYNVLPQGLKTSVGSFSRAMDKILGHEVREYCVNYLDDLAIITTGSFDDHLEHIDAVLGKLSKAGMTCNLKKCEFFSKEVKMLGFIISTDGLKTDPEKIKAIQDFPIPKKLKHIRAFLGLCNFYRRFIPDYSIHTQPLCQLLKKEKGWKWENEHQEAFEKIKSLFIKTIQFHHPDFSKPYYLQTDSSGIGMAGVLYQKDDEGEMKILGFHSKVLKGAQLNWTVTEQEFYSVISCLEKFETYLRGSQVKILTDHKALTFVKNWKLYNARVTRWINYLEQFQYEIEHVSGKNNIVADILSRYLPDVELLQEEKVNIPEILYTEIKVNKELIKKFKDLVEFQRKDKEIEEIRNTLETSKQTQTSDSGNGHYLLENGILYFVPPNQNSKLICLPGNLRKDVILQVHLEMGHQGITKIIKYIKDRFYWKGITKMVKEIVRSCHDCQITKSNTIKYVGPCQSIVTNNIGDLIMVDLYGPLPSGQFGMKYILVVQDTFSKFVKFYELRKATALSVWCKTKKFFDIIKPKAVLSDNGSQFASKQWQDNMAKHGVKVLYTTVRNPRPNTTERVNKELGRLFRTYCRNNHCGWVSVLPNLENLYNNTYHESTGYTPCEIMYGNKTEISFDKMIGKAEENLDVIHVRERVRQNLEKASRARIDKFNNRYRIIQYQIGDLVKIKRLNKSDATNKVTKKFEALYEGPYVVAANPFRNVYILVEPKTKKVRGKFNTIHLSKYYERID
ncbi:unnamed protein product [Plutella xylostella]|uniref:(diamondback moth) hypothetical protein n=1 Tax=Plutella xylostella TaxID=51655 RepID=A0A8S4GC04_PLUXY|nr:unnamed protein product [Plutella xylostella]